MHNTRAAMRPNRMRMTLAQSRVSVNPTMKQNSTMTAKNGNDSTSRLENPTAGLASLGYLHTCEPVDRLHGRSLSQETATNIIGGNR